MITKTSLTLVCLVTLIAYNNATPYETTPSTTCNQETCDACPTCTFPTEDITASQLVHKSPFVVHLVTNGSIAQNLASQCYTHLEILPDFFVFFITSTKKDGTTFVDFVMYYDSPLGPGNYWFVGVLGSKIYTPIIAVGSVLKVSCPGDSGLYSGAVVTTAAGTPAEPLLDPFVVFGRSAHPDESCLIQAENYLKRFSGNSQFLRISTGTPVKCVASVLGIPVVNSDILFSNPDFQPIPFP